MRIKTEKYCIELTYLDSYSLSENDKVYFPGNFEYEIPTKIKLSSFENNNILNSAIIGSFGGGTGIHDTSQIIENDRIIICCSESIFCLSIPELDLIWQTKTDSESCFEIYKVDNFYIIHGETMVSRIDYNGNIIWQKGGKDIFTTQEGIDDFIINESHIFVKDWENNIYKFDYNGNEFE